MNRRDIQEPDVAQTDLSSEHSLGGGESIAPYHPLALDPSGGGIAGWIDRNVERATRWLNPILVKEARQSLKSKQFLFTYFGLLTASCGWTILGIVFNTPDIYYFTSGPILMAGYFVVLSVSMFALVPLVAFHSLAAELNEGTYEMLAITRLSAWRIVTGKMNSAILQMVIFFSAVVPCLAFCYLLRGIDLSTILLSITIAFITAMVLTSLALLLSTLARGRTAQTLILVGLVAFIFFVDVYCCAVVAEEVLDGRWTATVMGFASTVLMAGSFVVLFLATAAARIAPVTENRSTRLRGILFVQQVIWIVTVSYGAIVYEDLDWINIGIMMLGIFWFFVGVFVLAESSIQSPRIRRDWPATFLTRAIGTWWMPGPGTGFMFVTATSLAGFFALVGVAGLIPMLGIGTSSVRTPPIIFASLMSGYVLGFVGLVRLISMPIMARLGPGVMVPVIVAVLLLFLAIVVPAVVDVAIFGEVSDDYTALHATNWMWSLIETFDGGSLLPEAGFLVGLSGLFIAGINVLLLFREFSYQRIAIPPRVKEDLAAD